MITGLTFDELFYTSLSELSEKGKRYSPRGQETIELLNTHLKLLDPKASILSNPNRKISKKYIGAEILWYLNGNRSIDEIKPYAKMWEQIADKDGKVNSCYGWQIFTQKTPGKEKTQWNYVLENLKTDKFSRQAILNINQPIHKYKTKDVPCTISIQYLIRDNKLHCIATMRSCDIIFGLGNDIPFFTFLQIKLLNDLKRTYKDLELGEYNHNVGSLHIYERHYEMLEKILNDDNIYESESWSSITSRNIQKCMRWKNLKNVKSK